MFIKNISQNERNAKHTKAEINHQPSLWRKIWESVYARREEIQDFIEQNLLPADNIILTGAGTSAYIGIAAQRSFRKQFSKVAEPISTTQIVSHPKDFFIKDKNLFLVSFARSGNSPESVAAITLAKQLSNKCSQLIITCNEEGAIAKKKHGEDTLVFLLPPEANDKSLAMTSSFTGMLLASILISRIHEIEELEQQVDLLCSYGRQCLEWENIAKEIAHIPFERAVFLGSGALYGVAKEGQLKMQELTDGLVVGKQHSFMGLRHGPKVIIDESTLLVYHFSNDPHAMKYEIDLLESIKENSNPIAQVAIGEHLQNIQDVDWVFDFGKEDGPRLDEDFLSIASVVPAQMLGLFKSLHLGLIPDNPSRNGAISRVVKGVNIYNL